MREKTTPTRPNLKTPAPNRQIEEPKSTNWVLKIPNLCHKVKNSHGDQEIETGKESRCVIDGLWIWFALKVSINPQKRVDSRSQIPANHGSWWRNSSLTRIWLLCEAVQIWWWWLKGWLLPPQGLYKGTIPPLCFQSPNVRLSALYVNPRTRVGGECCVTENTNSNNTSRKEHKPSDPKNKKIDKATSSKGQPYPEEPEEKKKLKLDNGKGKMKLELTRYRSRLSGVKENIIMQKNTTLFATIIGKPLELKDIRKKIRNDWKFLKGGFLVDSEIS